MRWNTASSRFSSRRISDSLSITTCPAIWRRLRASDGPTAGANFSVAVKKLVLSRHFSNPSLCSLVMSRSIGFHNRSSDRESASLKTSRFAPPALMFILFCFEGALPHHFVRAHSGHLPRDFDVRRSGLDRKAVIANFVRDDCLRECADDRELVAEVAVQSLEPLRKSDYGLAVRARYHIAAVDVEDFGGFNRGVKEVLIFRVERVIDLEVLRACHVEIAAHSEMLRDANVPLEDSRSAPGCAVSGLAGHRKYAGATRAVRAAGSAAHRLDARACYVARALGGTPYGLYAIAGRSNAAGGNYASAVEVPAGGLHSSATDAAVSAPAKGFQADAAISVVSVGKAAYSLDANAADTSDGAAA